MKKLNVILHETTIIDFPFFWKMILRYKGISFIIPLIVLIASAVYYNGQNDIYQRRKYFKNLTADVNNTSSAIASVLGEKTSSLTESEIMGLVSSLDFQQDFSERILKSEAFNKLDLGLLKEKEDFSIVEVFKACGANKKCKIDTLRGRIFSFVTILPDPIVTNKYYMQVSTKDPFTTRFLLDEVSDQIVANRVDSIKHKIEEQIKLSKELAEEKRSKIDSVNLKSLVAKKKSLEGEIKELNDKVSDFNRHYQRLTIDLALVETKVNETQKASQGKIETDQILASEKRKTLEEKIRKYEQDINAIKSLSASLSAQDAAIVGQLKKKLSLAKKKLKKSFDAGRAISSTTKFILDKEGESRYTEFNYRVLKEQVKKTKEDHDKMVEERDKRVRELASVEAKIEDVRPSFEYLKLLDQKIVQLDFFNSTVISDLKFESELSPVKRYKKTSKSKVILFSLMLSFITLTFVVIFLYLLDDRIFDQAELSKSFEDLDIIGNTPNFD
ncbi:MAG: hypothetical protein VXV96_00700 [Bdellovibrionota bacterium]|nr:hypothetical protein [Bdellovibrionota bacterium]